MSKQSNLEQMSGRKILKNNSAWEGIEDHPNNLELKVIVKTSRNSTYILIFELKLQGDPKRL